ncbi:DUF2514 family protein [Pseudomonas plecoglossicida]|uniref:DUF2514 family protein n=1 Tax=Pseudomonas plecoglossicida TaxID=70775 RepID=UPI0035C1D576
MSVEGAKAGGRVSAQRDSGDCLAEVIGERGARQEEERRATEQEEARAHANEKRTTADADADAAGSGCATKVPSSPPPSVAPALIPPLSPEAAGRLRKYMRLSTKGFGSPIALGS